MPQGVTHIDDGPFGSPKTTQVPRGSSSRYTIPWTISSEANAARAVPDKASFGCVGERDSAHAFPTRLAKMRPIHFTMGPMSDETTTTRRGRLLEREVCSQPRHPARKRSSRRQARLGNQMETTDGQAFHQHWRQLPQSIRDRRVPVIDWTGDECPVGSILESPPSTAHSPHQLPPLPLHTRIPQRPASSSASRRT